MEQPLSLSELRKMYLASTRTQIEDFKEQNPDLDLDPVFDLLLKEVDTEIQAAWYDAEQKLKWSQQDLPETPERSETL